MRFCQRYSVARAIPTPFAATAALNPRPIRRRQRSSASRLIAAALDGGFAAIRRDAARPLRITWPGRPNTCIGGSPEVGVSQLQLRRPPEPGHKGKAQFAPLGLRACWPTPAVLLELPVFVGGWPREAPCAAIRSAQRRSAN